MKLSRPMSLFLVAFGVWSWVIWPTFLQNIWNDPRSFNDGPTAFFTVHLVLVIVSLVLGTTIGVLGVRGFLATRRR
ncbi:SCO4848 family membrane protein [Lentzea sp. NPDC051213]|uniref:SCO4848 family membrane protein n=1 Tax=Lentzea sp. NPDC051213 TaxID=3364126 RepID=UPI0037B10B63